jgi:septal ring factor EnvC (AmiA/AmiB activator)
LSRLTKILIVLLTLSSIFLCGIVVTYVANADNYRQKHKDLKADRDSLNSKAKSLKKQVNEKIDQAKQLEDKLNSEIASLKAEIGQSQNEFKNAEREKAALLQKVNSWASIVEDFSQTNDKQGLLLKNTLDELNKVQAEQIKQEKQLTETTATLVEKMAVIETLEAEKKRLLEEKTELQSRLDQFLQPFGKTAAVPVPVTPDRAMARPALMPIPAVKDIALQGLVTEVDMKNSIAGISLGKADGVKEGMKFHVTRGDKFLCDIVIIDVDTEEAVGVLDLVQQQPRIGDNVSTGL